PRRIVVAWLRVASDDQIHVPLSCWPAPFGRDAWGASPRLASPPRPLRHPLGLCVRQGEPPRTGSPFERFGPRVWDRESSVGVPVGDRRRTPCPSRSPDTRFSSPANRIPRTSALRDPSRAPVHESGPHHIRQRPSREVLRAFAPEHLPSSDPHRDARPIPSQFHRPHAGSCHPKPQCHRYAPPRSKPARRNASPRRRTQSSFACPELLLGHQIPTSPGERKKSRRQRLQWATVSHNSRAPSTDLIRRFLIFTGQRVLQAGHGAVCSAPAANSFICCCCTRRLSCWPNS